MQESSHDAETLGLLSFALVTSLHIAQKLQGCDGTFYFSHDLRGLFIQMHISIPALHRHQSLMHATHETQGELGKGVGLRQAGCQSFGEGVATKSAHSLG